MARIHHSRGKNNIVAITMLTVLGMSEYSTVCSLEPGFPAHMRRGGWSLVQGSTVNYYCRAYIMYSLLAVQILTYLSIKKVLECSALSPQISQCHAECQRDEH